MATVVWIKALLCVCELRISSIWGELQFEAAPLTETLRLSEAETRATGTHTRTHKHTHTAVAQKIIAASKKFNFSSYSEFC